MVIVCVYVCDGGGGGDDNVWGDDGVCVGTPICNLIYVLYIYM